MYVIKRRHRDIIKAHGEKKRRNLRMREQEKVKDANYLLSHSREFN